jgi:hypothetical protein
MRRPVGISGLQAGEDVKPALVAELQKKQKEEKRHPGIYTRWFSVTVYMHPTFYVSWFFPKLIRGGWWPSVEFAYRRMRS